MARPREHDEETRRRLLASGRRILAEGGPGALTNRRLAAEVDTTTRAIYSQFGSKSGLLRALFREAAEAMAESLNAVPRRDDPLDELLECALAYRDAAIEHPQAYRLQFEGGLAGFEPNEEDRALTRRNFDRVGRTIQRCVDEGLFPGRKPEAIALQTWATIHGLASLEIHGHLFPAERAEARWRDHVTAMLEGYQHPPAD